MKAMRVQVIVVKSGTLWLKIQMHRGQESEIFVLASGTKKRITFEGPEDNNNNKKKKKKKKKKKNE